MRITFLVFCFCYLTHAVVQQQTGQSKATNLSHIQLKGTSKSVVSVSQRSNAVYQTRTSNINNKHLKNYKIDRMARETINIYPTSNNEEGVDTINKHRVNGEDGGLDPVRKRRNVNQAGRIEYLSTGERSEIYSTTALPAAGLSDTVHQLVLEMRTLHKQQQIDRQNLASLRQQFRSKLSTIRNERERIEKTGRQIKRIQLVLQDFEAENKITRNEISTIKHNQQRVLKRLHSVSRSNKQLVNEVNKISDICKGALFSFGPGNDPDESQVINSSINVIDADSGEIQDDIRKLKENMEAANLKINLQANVSTVLEDKINKTLVVLRNIERRVSQMQDGITLGQSVRATKVGPSSTSHERKMSSKGHQNMMFSKKKLEFNDQPERKQSSEEVQRRDGGKRRKSRHLSSLALIIERSERNVEDASKKNHEEVLLQDNNVGDKTVHAYGVLGTRLGVDGNNKITFEEATNETSLSNKITGSLEEPELILLQEAGPILPSSCCPHLDQHLLLSTAAADLDTVSGTSISSNSSWSSLPSSSTDGRVSSMLVPELQTPISDAASMSGLHETEPPELRHMITTSEQFLLSNSIAAFQHTVMKTKEQMPLSIHLASSSTLILSPLLSQTLLLVEPLNFDLPRSEIKDDPSLHADDVSSSSDWSESSSPESHVGLASIVDVAKEGTLAVSWTTTDDRDSGWPESFEATSPHLSATSTPSHSLEPLLEKDFFYNQHASLAIQASTIDLQSSDNMPSSSSNTTPELSATQTTLSWFDATSSPCTTCYTSYLSTTESRISSTQTTLSWFDATSSPCTTCYTSYLSTTESRISSTQTTLSWFDATSSPCTTCYTSYLSTTESRISSTQTTLSKFDATLSPCTTCYTSHPSTTESRISSFSIQSEPLVSFDQIDASYFSPVEPRAYTITPGLGLSEIQQSSLHEALSISREDFTHIINSLESPHATPSIDFLHNHIIYASSSTPVAPEMYSGIPVPGLSDSKRSKPHYTDGEELAHIISSTASPHSTQSVHFPSYPATDPSSMRPVVRVLYAGTPVLDWSDIEQSPFEEKLRDVTQERADNSQKAITFLTFSHTVNSDSTDFDQTFSNLRISKTSEVDISTPVINLSAVKSSSIPGNRQGAIEKRPGNSEKAVTRSIISHTLTPEDSTNLDHADSSLHTSETVKVDVTTHPIDGSAVESSSLIGQLLTVIPIGAKDSENANSKYEYVAQSEDTTNRDQIYPSSRISDTIELDTTTPVIYWSDSELSLIDKLHDEMTIAAEETVNTINSSTVSHLAPSLDLTNLVYVDSPTSDTTNLVYVDSPTSETINHVAASAVIDGSDVEPFFPVENLPDLLSTRVDLGRHARRRPSTQSDDHVHHEEMIHSRATSAGSQNPTILSESDASRSSSIDSLPDATPTRETTDTDISTSQSDFWSMQLNLVGSSDDSKARLTTGAVPEVYTFTPAMDWSDGVASFPFGLLRDGLSTGSAEVETIANSLSGSRVVQFEPLANSDHSSSGSATFATPTMSSVAYDITWPGLEAPSAKGNIPDVISATVEEVTLSITHSRYFNNMNASDKTPGTLDANTSQVLDNLPSSQTVRNMSVTFGRETNVLNANQTDQMSKSASTHNKTSDQEYTRYIRHLEQRLTVLEKSMVQLASGRMPPSQDVSSSMLNTSINLQTELEAYVENRTSDLMQQLGRDTLLVQRQQHDLKQEFEKQQMHVQSQTSGLMKELERQRFETKDLKEELEKQKVYATMQISEMTQEMGRHKVDFENQTSDVMQKLSEQNLYIDNRTQSLQEQLHTETANVGRIRNVAARTYKKVNYLARQVSAINMEDFTSRLRESLHNFTKNVLTQEQWRVSSQRIVNASLENEVKISQLQTTLMDTAHSLTKLQGRVRDVKLMGERWYKSLQGHVIRLNNTVQDLREDALHLADVNRDKTTDYSLDGNDQLRDRLDNLVVQLLYNTNRLSSLEASMLNLSLAECRRPLAEANQASKILALNERQDEIRKELATMKEKVKAVHLATFKVQSSAKSAEKALSSLRGNVSSLGSLVPGVQALRREMDNVLSLVPQDCQEHFNQGNTQSGTYVIYPKKFNRTVLVYCLMEDSRSTKCDNRNSCNKRPNHISHNSGFSQRGDKNNDRVSAADSLSETTDNINITTDNKNITCCTGWTVIQRRTTGLLNFSRSWTEYAEGFGTADSEYWAGNDFIHTLSAQKDYELRVLMEDMSSTIWAATYSQFKLAGKEDAYRMHVSGYYGNITDGMASCDSAAFSTADFDNDGSSSHCALFNGGGWWYQQCHVTNLNGPYNIGMVWFNSELQDWIQMRSSMMMIRPRTE